MNSKDYRRRIEIISEMIYHKTVAVSYTHLDVYKRQGVCMVMQMAYPKDYVRKTAAERKSRTQVNKFKPSL